MIAKRILKNVILTLKILIVDSLGAYLPDMDFDG